MLIYIMAVQAQLCPENLGNLPMCSLQMQQEWVVDNPVLVLVPVHVSSSAIDDDLRFSFQQPHRQNYFVLAHQNLGFVCNRVASSSSSSTRGANVFPSMATLQLELQRQELDNILHVQSERLRSALLEQRKQQLGFLLKCVESKARNLMRQKEEDLAQATKKAMELLKFV